MVEPITESEIALDKAKKQLRAKGYLFYGVVPLNNARYWIVQGIKEYDGLNILLVFKREWFLMYGQMFKNQGASGIGETINAEHIEIANKYDCKLLARISTDGVLFITSLEQFIDENNIKARRNKEGKITISNSAHLFKNFNNYKDMQECRDLLLNKPSLMDYIGDE